MAGKWVKPEKVAEAKDKGYKKDPKKDRKETGEVFMTAPGKEK